MTQLFRKQALEAQSQRLTGTISLAQPLSLKVVTATIVIIVLLVLTYLFQAQYVRKETVQGFLRPDKGVIKAYSNRSGTIKKLLVENGQYVKKGAPLVNITNQQITENGQVFSQELLKTVQQKQQLLKEELEQLSLLQGAELKQLHQQEEAILKAIELSEAQKHLAQQKADLIKKQQAQYDKLLQENHLSLLKYQQQQERHINAQQEVQNLAKAVNTQNDELSRLRFKYAHLPQQYKSQKRELQQQLTDLARQKTELMNNFSTTVVAAHSGTITDIQVVEGETLNNVRPLLTIIPKESTLVAELLLPTRSAGFVEQGDIAKLRFDAFPHQRFGFVNSKVHRIDKTLINQGDVDFPIAFHEPVYRIQAKLDQQAIKGYGREFNLKSGMIFTADIMLEQRSLIDWMFDPILSLQGRLN